MDMRSRREFLQDAGRLGKAVLVGSVLVPAVYSPKVSAQNFSMFEFSTELQTQYPARGMYVHKGGIDESFNTLGIVNQREVLPYTSEYEAIQKGKIEKGTAKEAQAIVSANNKFLSVVENYAQQNRYDSIIEEELLEAYHFLSVPEQYRIYNSRGRLKDEQKGSYDVDMKALMGTPSYGGANITQDIISLIE